MNQNNQQASPIEFRTDQVRTFKNLAAPGKWKDVDLNIAARTLRIDGLGDTVLEKPLSRMRLRDLAGDAQVSDRDLIWAILAWGRINIFHGRSLARQDTTPLEQEIAKLRGQRLPAPDRAEVYATLTRTLDENGIKGLGPAFLTKLIFFVPTLSTGYIMDKWTAGSVNLLCTAPFIKLNTNRNVEGRNGPQIYDRFCKAVDEIAKLHPTPEGKTCSEYAEMCLFGTGGRGKAACAWRRHVRDSPMARPNGKKGIPDAHPG
jgi:hypothetical protein